MSLRVAGESAVAKGNHCRRIVGCDPPAKLVVRLHSFDVGFPSKSTPSNGAMKLEECVAMKENMLDVDLEASDGGAARGRNAC